MNEVLAELPFETRLLFIGLWTLADREGRFEDRPKRIRAQLFPLDFDLDVDSMIASLCNSGFLIRYQVDGARYCQILNFTKHQTPHHKEVASEIPPPNGMPAITKHGYDVSKELREYIFSRDGNQCLKCGAHEQLTIDHIKPLAKGGDNDSDNLQTLCKRCNSSKSDTTYDYRRGNVKSTLDQRCANHDASCPSDSLIPDSLNLIPDSGLLGEPPQAAPSQKAKKSAKKTIKTPMPEGFCISESVRKWAQQKGHQHLERHFESFVAKVEANGYTYANWDAAFRNAITDDWAKVRQLPRGSPPTYESAKDKSRRETYAALTGQNHEQRTLIDIN